MRRLNGDPVGIVLLRRCHLCKSVVISRSVKCEICLFAPVRGGILLINRATGAVSLPAAFAFSVNL